MTHPADPERKTGLFLRAARAFGLAALREDPGRFERLLERTIGENQSYFVPSAEVDQLSQEERRIHGGRLEDLVEDAVHLASELYSERHRDTALLCIANQVERAAVRIWKEPWRFWFNCAGRPLPPRLED